MLHLLFSTQFDSKQPDVNHVYINNEFSYQTKSAECSKTQQATQFICVINAHESVAVSDTSIDDIVGHLWPMKQLWAIHH